MAVGLLIVDEASSRRLVLIVWVVARGWVRVVTGFGLNMEDSEYNDLAIDLTSAVSFVLSSDS